MNKFKITQKIAKFIAFKFITGIVICLGIVSTAYFAMAAFTGPTAGPEGNDDGLLKTFIQENVTDYIDDILLGMQIIGEPDDSDIDGTVMGKINSIKFATNYAETIHSQDGVLNSQTYYYNGGNPYYCLSKTIVNGKATNQKIYNGQTCNADIGAVCTDGECLAYVDSVGGNPNYCLRTWADGTLQYLNELQVSAPGKYCHDGQSLGVKVVTVSGSDCSDCPNGAQTNCHFDTGTPMTWYSCGSYCNLSPLVYEQTWSIGCYYSNSYYNPYRNDSASTPWGPATLTTWENY